MCEFVIRKATLEDKADIAALSRGADPLDYIPYVLDRWFSEPFGAILVADLGGAIVGLARLSLFSPVDGWLEGLRVRRDMLRRGIGRSLTQAMLGQAGSMGLKTLRFCTTFDNEASLGLNQSLGCSEYAGFRVLHLDARHAEPMAAIAGRYMIVPAEACTESVMWFLDSSYLRSCRGLLPHGFRFEPVRDEVLMNLIRLGTAMVAKSQDGETMGGLILDDNPESEPGDRGLVIRFLDGCPLAMSSLIEYAASYACSNGASSLEFMAPCDHASYASALGAGFRDYWPSVPMPCATIVVMDYPESAYARYLQGA